MKAAVLHKRDEAPRYEDFPDPTLEGQEVHVKMQAVALENVVKMIANGSHYASKQFLPQLPAIVGLGAIGTLDSGQLVGYGAIRAPYGSIAEHAAAGYYLEIPEGVDATVAAVVPSSTMTALFPLKWGGEIPSSQTVLINGATGFAGKLAVQVAKLLGVKRIVGTGRDEESLAHLQALGADAVIDLKQSDEQVAEAFTREAGDGYSVILDYLWGHPTEILIKTLIPNGLGFGERKIRLVQIGEKAGANITLSASALRTSGLEIGGAGGNITPEMLQEGMSLVWEWLKAGKLQADIEKVPLSEIESAWNREELKGKRIVIVP